MGVVGVTILVHVFREMRRKRNKLSKARMEFHEVLPNGQVFYSHNQ